MRQQKDYTWINKAGLASSVGFIIVSATALGFLFGSWLDVKLGTDPWMVLVFTLIGVAAGFYETVRIVIQLSK